MLKNVNATSTTTHLRMASIIFVRGSAIKHQTCARDKALSQKSSSLGKWSVPSISFFVDVGGIYLKVCINNVFLPSAGHRSGFSAYSHIVLLSHCYLISLCNVLKTNAFYNVKPCDLVGTFEHFGGISCNVRQSTRPSKYFIYLGPCIVNEI